MASTPAVRRMAGAARCTRPAACLARSIAREAATTGAVYGCSRRSASARDALSRTPVTAARVSAAAARRPALVFSGARWARVPRRLGVVRAL